MSPVLVFRTLEAKAYFDKYGVYKENATDESLAGLEDHYTTEVTAWRDMLLINAGIWGPMFFFGILSLSDKMNPSTSIYIEHVLSNAMIPAYLYELYLLFEVAVYDEGEGWAMWSKLSVWFLISSLLL